MERADAAYEGGANAKQAMAAREKRWNELGIEEKVERLRGALRMANERAASGQHIAIEANDIAKRHEHGGLGAVLMPADSNVNRPLAGLGIRRRDETEGDYVERLLA